MKVLSVMCAVMVCVGQACQGATVGHQRPPVSLWRHTHTDPLPPEPGEAATDPEPPNTYQYVAPLQKYLKTVINDKEMKHRTEAQTRSDRPKDGRAGLTDSELASLTATKLPAAPPRPPHPSAGDPESKAKGSPLLWRHVRPRPPHPPVEMPEVVPCRTPRKPTPHIATAPPNVCDLCPDEDGKNPLAPCTCVGVGGTSTGQISISCPSSIVSLDQLRDIFHNTNFLVTHVFQFKLQGSDADGALTRDIWGDLDFKYVSINHNKITDVDNGAFISSRETLIGLNLANNEIRSFVAMYNDLPNLLSLNLRGNNISLVYSEDFNYPSLNDLDLSFNQITSIGMHSFAGLKKLTQLNLSYNLLTTIGDERFTFIDHDYTNALVINLSHNKITSISDTAFLGLRSVEIDLRNNQLHTLKKVIFDPIISSSQYYAFFHFMDNPMVCDCSIKWVLQDSYALSCFDNFLCTNNGKHLWYLTIDDLGNCTLSSAASHP